MVEESILESIRKTPEYVACSKKGIDAEAIIKTASETERYQKYKSPQTRLSILKAALNSAGFTNVSADSDPFDETLVLFGGCDSWGTKRPVNIAAMRKDGSFVTVSLWDSDMIKMPCKARVVGIYDAKWHSVNPNREDGFRDVTEMSLENCQKMLQKVSMSPENTKDWQKIDAMERYKIYALAGRIQWINGTPIFNADNQRVGENPVICKDGRQPPKNHVTVGITLNSNESGYSVGLQLPRQRVGSPVIAIPDFADVCYDAFETHKDSSKDQCKMVRDMCYDRRVIAVGQASSIKEKANKDGNDILYINLTCGFIMEENPDISDLAGRETLVKEKGAQKSEFVETAERKIIDALIVAGHTLNTNPADMPIDTVRSIAKPPNFIDDELLEQCKAVASAEYEEQIANEVNTPDNVKRYTDEIVAFYNRGGGAFSAKPAGKLRELLNIPDEVSDDEILAARESATAKVAEIKQNGE